MKRYASHYLYVSGIGFLKQHVVQLNKGQVVRLFPLTEELESVEWMPGVIVLSTEDHIDNTIKELNAFGERSTLLYTISAITETEILASGLTPYLLYPFNFTSMKPFAGTRHRLLQ